ncbi:MAG TPA: hypothetical protein VIZ28_08520 [Chitinophagaceae bacterium]
MSPTPQVPGTPKEILRATRIFYGAIIAGAILFGVIVFALNNIQGPLMPELKEYGNIFLYAAAGMAILCLLVAFNSYNKGVAAAKDPLIPLPAKLNLYRNTLVRYAALCEAPALFSIIVLFMTANYASLIITAGMIAAMLAKSPTRQRVIDELALDWKQQKELE